MGLADQLTRKHTWLSLLQKPSTVHSAWTSPYSKLECRVGWPCTHLVQVTRVAMSLWMQWSQVYRRHCFALVLPDFCPGEGAWWRCPICGWLLLALWTRDFKRQLFYLSIAVTSCLHTNIISILSSTNVLRQFYSHPTFRPCLSSSSQQACSKAAPILLCPLSCLFNPLQPGFFTYPFTDDQLSRW